MKNYILHYFYTTILISANVIGYPIKQLLTPSRFDIAAKYLYAEHYYNKLESSWPKRVYLEHAKSINNFQETWPEKHSADDFIESFHSLIDSITINGFNPSSFIPVDQLGNICNGAHRTAACLLFGINPPIRVYTQAAPIISSKTLQARGLLPIYLDAIALQYCALKEESFVAVIFPTTHSNIKLIKEILSPYATIVYEKVITLTNQGKFNLICDLYEGQPWTGSWENDFAGIRGKMNRCFPEKSNNVIHVLLLESDSLQTVIAGKNAVRQQCGRGNDSIHITDTHAEALALAQTCFINNSIHLLNHANHQLFPHFEKYFSQYRSALQAYAHHPSWYCVDSSAVLAAYGLRDCADLDYIHHAQDDLHGLYNAIESHNSSKHHHALSLDEIIHNPLYHCYYRGVKFASLDVVAAMKRRRNEPKDQADLLLMHHLLRDISL